MSGVAVAVVLTVYLVVFGPTFIAGRLAPDVKPPFASGLALLVAGIVAGDGVRIWLDQPVLSMVLNQTATVGLVLMFYATMTTWVEVLAESWLIGGCVTLIGLLPTLVVLNPPTPMGASLDIIQVGLSLFVFQAVSRTLGVTLPTAHAGRLVARIILIVRVVVWSSISWHSMGLFTNGLIVARVLIVLMIPTSLGMVLSYRTSPNRPRYYKPIETSPVLPYVLAGIVVAMVATVLSFYQAAGRLSVLVLTAGCAVALLGRQLVGNHRLSVMIAHSREQEHYFRTLVQDSTDVIMICDAAGRLRYVSPAVENLLPADAGLPTEGDRVHEVLGVAEDRLLASLASVHSGDQLLVEGRRGEQVLEASLTARGDEFVLSVRDVSERDRLRERLHDMAFHDALTGLANRHRLLEEVGELLTLEATARGRGTGAVTALFIDLDRFKSINDASGHHVGDLVLGQVAERLRAVVPLESVLARLGGDEFVAVLVGDSFTVEDVAQRIHEPLIEPFPADERVYQIGASIGIAQSQPGVSAEELIQRADLAMYEAKQARRPWRVYEPAMWATVQSQLEADQLIARSWGPQSAVMFVQPVVFTRTFAVHSTEALLRWRGLDGQVGSPSAVLGFAQRTGRLAALTEWMLSMAVDELAERRLVDVPIAVNMPPQLLTNPATIDQLAVALRSRQVPAARLHLEITEEAMVEQGTRGLDALHRLREQGFKLHVDDFGTGYSSLSYLIRLPVDAIKIDRSFVSALPRSTAARSVVMGLVSLSRELGVDLIGEGVESQEEHEWLVRLGVPLAQGYWYARPEDVADVADRGSLSAWSSANPVVLARARGALSARPRPFALGG